MTRGSARSAALLIGLLAAACTRPPVSEEMRIELSGNDDTALITVDTTFDLDPKSAEDTREIERARSGAEMGTDPWSVRFSRVTPEVERVTFQKRRGALERVTHSARIPIDDLQRLFSDMNVTVAALSGDGWREITLYPGTSARASRVQKRHFDEALLSWSNATARYFAAVDRLDAYMDEHPDRAQPLFAAVVGEKAEDGSPEPAISDEEQPLLEDVDEAVSDIATRMDEEQEDGATLAEEADLLFNPFPAKITIRVQGHILATEGFDESKDGLVIAPVDLFDAIVSLEGRWISPDPLAALSREEKPSSQQLAAVERRSQPVVSAAEIAKAVEEKLARPSKYVVRWEDERGGIGR